MVTRRTKDGGDKSGSPRKKTSKRPAGQARPAKQPPETKPSKKTTGKVPARAASRTRPAKGEPDPQQERLNLLLQEKSELQSIVRRLRAERDSALAEGTRLQDRIQEMETEASRRSAREPQTAGPGAFDASELEEEENGEGGLAEDELEGAAGFFDRMDEIRARRIELDRERNDRELEQSDQSFWMICPKCGDLMEEQESENIKVERCENCGGLYLDRGEVDLLLSLTNDREGLRRLHNILKF